MSLTRGKWPRLFFAEIILEIGVEMIGIVPGDNKHLTDAL
jgi:hypothetical protein